MAQSPLAGLMRPQTLEDFVGHEQLVGKEGIINKLIENAKKTNFFPSLVFWGPPGSGKTTLARIISHELNREFYEFSAVNTKITDIEKVIASTDKKEPSIQSDLLDFENTKTYKKKILKPNPIQENLSPIVFIDEIHRFNKAQQDKLLPHVEEGRLIMIGATTENPSFEVIGPLLSRSRVLVLKRLEEGDIQTIAERALKKLKKSIEPEGLNFLIEAANGDARVALNVLEIAAHISGKKISLDNVEQALQRRQYTFDKQGEEYYNVISSFIKSMRASDADAALYYLARMVAAGQDPLYIARRMVVFASEDVASPTALVVANAVFRACETVGYPECQENLAAGTVYLSLAEKDRRAYDAYMKALEDVNRYGNLPVPMEIRNAPTKLMKDLGYGKDYQPYTKESLLPEKLKGKIYYQKDEQ